MDCRIQRRDLKLAWNLASGVHVRRQRHRDTFVDWQGRLIDGSFCHGAVELPRPWFDEPCLLHHYRDKDQDEIDIVVEAHDGRLIGVEVKAAATVNSGDFKGLRKLSAACAANFKLGVVLYDGTNIVPFGQHLFAAPMSCTWG